jgi:hypothetical protein
MVIKSKKHFKSKKIKTKHRRNRPSRRNRLSRKNRSSRRNRLSRRNRKKWRGGNEDYSLTNIKSILESKIQEETPFFSGLLKMECKNPDNCLALGQYEYALKKYFKDFKDLNLIDNSKLKRLAKPSKNGFIIEVPFKKGGYTAYTVLKCSNQEKSDNLYYEYYVGKHFINKYIKKFPCFVETFGCYYLNGEIEWQQLKNCALNNSFEGIHLKNIITPFINVGESDTDLFKKSCIKNKLICVLIQHFDNVRTFSHEYIFNHHNICGDLYHLLYQVYFSLTQLGNTYTHYDLHRDNVLLYKPYEGNQYITMRYHSRGQIYEFKTEYISKIIDYGRNYIKLSNGVDTNNLLTNPNGICRLSECRPDCGINVGYNVIQGNADYDGIESAFNTFYIFPNMPNMSHDLRLAKLFNINEVNYQKTHGTPENLRPGTENKINNIFDMRDFLEKIMINMKIPYFNQYNNKYKTWKEMAIMEIFDDGQNYTYTVLPQAEMKASEELKPPAETKSHAETKASEELKPPAETKSHAETKVSELKSTELKELKPADNDILNYMVENPTEDNRDNALLEKAIVSIKRILGPDWEKYDNKPNIVSFRYLPNNGRGIALPREQNAFGMLKEQKYSNPVTFDMEKRINDILNPIDMQMDGFKTRIGYVVSIVKKMKF